LVSIAASSTKTPLKNKKHNPQKGIARAAFMGISAKFLLYDCRSISYVKRGR
jgi:hypothetical protein